MEWGGSRASPTADTNTAQRCGVWGSPAAEGLPAFSRGGQAQSQPGKSWLLSGRHCGSLCGWPKSPSLLGTATRAVFSGETEYSHGLGKKVPHKAAWTWDTRARLEAETRWWRNQEGAPRSHTAWVLIPGLSRGLRSVSLEQIP